VSSHPSPPPRVVLACGLLALSVAASSRAAGDAGGVAAQGAPAVQAPVPATAASSAAIGLIVVSLAGATDAAWPLAQAVYGSGSLRPRSLDEAHARVLCGEAAPGEAASDLRDLAQMVAAIHGDDAPSRALLGEVARRFSARGVVVVGLDDGQPNARVFVADSSAFDAARYRMDEGGPLSWSSALQSLERTWRSEPPAGVAPARPVTRAPALATRESGQPTPTRREFYQSGWFWGALGAAAFGAGAIFLATRDSRSSTIHLQVQVPH
jgi:hypothetical protein